MNPRAHPKARSAMAALLLAAVAGPSLAAEALEDLESLLAQPVYAASKFAQDAGEAPAAVTVITAGDIRAFGWRTLAEVLNAVRGISMRDDRLYTYVGVRGLAPPGDYSSRVLLMIDGMRVNDNLYDQAVAGREFPLAVDLIERVEVIAGPGSALYGSNAILAVVNVVSKSVSHLGGGSAGLAIGDRGARLVSVRQGLRLGEGSLVVAGRVESRPGRDHYYAEYDSPPASDGWARGRDAERDRKLFAKWSQGAWTSTLLLSDRRKDTPTGAYEADFNQPSISSDRYAMGDLQWQERRGTSQWFVRGTLARYEYDGYSLYGGDRWISLGYGHWAATEARWQHDGWQGHRLVLGFESQANLRQDQIAGNVAQPGLLTRVDASSHRFGIFVNDEWTLTPQWRLALGLRGDRLLSGEYEWTPRLGLVWTPLPGMHWKVLAGRAFREPNVYEARFEDGATAAANPGLGAERLHARELALDWRVLPNLRVAASWYHNDIDGLINQQVMSATGMLQYVNQGSAHAQGLELEIDHVADSGWRTRANVSQQRTRDADSGQPLVNAARLLAKLHVVGPLPLPGFKLGLEAQHVGRRATVSGATLAPQTQLHGTLQWNAPDSRWSFSATIHNLGDRALADPAGPEHLQASIAGDGRRFTAAATLSY